VANAQIDEDEFEFTPLPYLPNATFAQRNFAVQVTSDDILDELIFMSFHVFGFATDDDAIFALDMIYERYLGVEQNALDRDLWHDYRAVSVGRLGVERRAFIAETREILDGSTGKRVHVFVQLGPNVLYLHALALGGETLEFVAEFMEEFLGNATEDPATLLPTLSTLPIGWELPTASSEDVVTLVTSAPTPTPLPPTPTLVPTLAPTPTPVPLIAEVNIILPSSVSERVNDGSCQGRRGFAFMINGQVVDITDSSNKGNILHQVILGPGSVIEDGKCQWTVTVGPLSDEAPFSYFFVVDGVVLGAFGPAILFGGEQAVDLEIRLADHPDLVSTNTSPTETPLTESDITEIPNTETMSGTITIRIGGVYVEDLGNGACQGAGFWKSIHERAPFLVSRRESLRGTPLFSAVLPVGQLVDEDVCEWTLKVMDAEQVRRFWVSNGSRAWGPFSSQELEEGIVIEEIKAGR
jgi:hypothetical protein